MLPGAGEPERPAHQRLRVVRLLRLDELEAHFPLLAKKAAAFRRKSRSIVVVFNSRRSRANSARSCEVSGPLGLRFSSTSARFTQARSAVSVRSSSLATSPMLLPLARTSCTTSALYSLVNFRRFRRSMDSILPHIGGVHSIGASSERRGTAPTRAVRCVAAGQQVDGIGEILNLRGGQAPEDAEDLLILPPLEHGHGDQQAEEGSLVAAAQRPDAYGEGTDDLRPRERLKRSEVPWSTVVLRGVPSQHPRRLADLRARRRRSFADC